MTNERDAAAAEPCLVVGSADGALYAIPQSVVEGYRLSDEQRAALEAQIKAEGGDVEGFYYGPSGNVGMFVPTPVLFMTFGGRRIYEANKPWQPIDYRPVVR